MANQLQLKSDSSVQNMFLEAQAISDEYNTIVLQYHRYPREMASVVLLVVSLNAQLKSTKNAALTWRRVKILNFKENRQEWLLFEL